MALDHDERLHVGEHCTRALDSFLVKNLSRGSRPLSPKYYSDRSYLACKDTISRRLPPFRPTYRVNITLVRGVGFGSVQRPLPEVDLQSLINTSYTM